MNLRDLNYIIAVSDLGHFGRAANKCNVSQPTLSGQILKLEEELGVAIFERVGKRVRATAAGEQIIAHARRAVSASGDIVSSARASRDPLCGVIRLGVIPTVAPYLMPYALPAVAEQMPRAPLTIVEDLTGRLLPPLAAGDLDAAIIATDADNDRLAAFDLYEEPFYLVMPRDHALAAGGEVDIARIDPGSLLLLSDGHCLRDQALELCEHGGVGEGAADVRAASLETLLELTAARYGLTLAPGLAIAGLREDQRLAARCIAGGRASRKVRLAYRRDTPRQRALAALANAIHSGLQESAPRDLGLAIGAADHF